jgi:membrane protease subunit HflC
VVIWRSFVAVDETQFVLVTEFGRHVATIKAPGLHGKLPWRGVQRFDNRLQLYDPKPSEFLTSDPKNILMDVYVCWRIENPLLFLQRMGDQPGAEARLHDIVWAELAAEIGRRPLSQLVSDQPGDMQTPEIMTMVRDRCRERIGSAFGIDVVDVRLKRLNLPEQNKQSVFDRMRAERDRIARQYRAEGEEQALIIRAEADRQKTELIADAKREAERTRGEAAAKAIEIYAEAHAKDPEFYRFLRSLDAYRNILTERTTLVLSAESELFQYLDKSTAPKTDRATAPEQPENQPEKNE